MLRLLADVQRPEESRSNSEANCIESGVSAALS